MAQLIIEAGQTERQYWFDLWRYRELFHVLAWRDISVRYKQTAVGVAWALLQPILMTMIYTFGFGRVGGLSRGVDIPYPLIVLAGMVPWQFFSNSLTASSQSVTNNANLISKIYFPRLIVPTSAIVTTLIDMLIALGMLLVLMLWYHIWPTWRLLFLPVLVVWVFAAALGPSLLLAALNVRYRDIKYVIPFGMQTGILISPVGFLSTVIPPEWRLFFSLNPLVGIIDGFRWVMLGGRTALYWPGFFISIGIVTFFLWVGIGYFRRMERDFADII